MTTSAESPSRTAIIAEANELLRLGLKAMLAPVARVVAETADGEQAIELAQKFHPDLAILDCDLETMTGVYTCKQICTNPPSPKVLMFVDSYCATKHFHKLKRFGASGFCLQHSGPSVFYEALDAIRQGQTYCDPEILDLVLQHKRSAAAALSLLTEREFEIWIRLDLRNKEIAEELDLPQTTIEQHVASILQKLNQQTRTGAALAAVDNGFTLLPKMPARAMMQGKSDELLQAEKIARDAIAKWREST